MVNSRVNSPPIVGNKGRWTECPKSEVTLATKMKYIDRKGLLGIVKKISSHLEIGARFPNFLSGVSICEAGCFLELAKPVGSWRVPQGHHQQSTRIGQLSKGQRFISIVAK